MKRLNSFSLTLLATSLLAACGGGTGTESSDVASGGIGGSGSGTVTGFGSIIINDIREFEFNDDSRIRIDGDDALESELKEGMVVEVKVGDDVNDDFTYGTLENVEAHHEVKGAITSVNPLRVLSQEISVVSATVLDDVPGGNIANLSLGHEVEISGHRDENGVIRASLIEFKAGGVDVWQLRGKVTATPSASTFNVGTQPIDYSAATVQNCGSGISVGKLVELKITPINSLSNGQTVTATQVECYTPGLGAANDNSSVKASFEGFIDNVTSATQFTLNGQKIQLSGNVVYEGGSSADLLVGAKVEAEGVFNGATDVLTAVKIRFREAEFRIEAPVSPGDVVTGQIVTLLGASVHKLSSTDDEDSIFAGLSSETQVEVRGFVDHDGTLYAEEIRDRGTPDPTDTLVRGPVEAKDATSVTILGMTVVINNATLLQQIRIGQEVKVSDADYNSATNTLSGGAIELED